MGDVAQRIQKARSNIAPTYFPASSAGEDDVVSLLWLDDIFGGNLFRAVLTLIAVVKGI